MRKGMDAKVSLVDLALEQVRIGTTIAFLWGFVVGVMIGVVLISMDNAYLLFPTTMSRIYALLFLASLLALLAVVIFLPLELALTVVFLVWARLRKINVVRLYTSVFAVGCLSSFAFLWFGFNLIRDPRSPDAIGLYFTVGTLALFILVVANRVRHKSPMREMHRVPGTMLLMSVALCGALTIMSYQSLAGFSEMTGQSRIVLAPQRISMPEASSASLSDRNVILISIDTLRADHLSCYGYSRSTSPNIERLAEDGVIFLNARSQAPWTLPSHASMFTSLYPTSHGARFSSQHVPIVDKLDDAHVTIAEMVLATGYRTAAYTSTFWLSEPWGLLQGFSEFRMDPVSHTATQLIDQGIRWIAADERRPFFLFLHFFDVHNYKSLPQFDGMYQDSGYNGKLRGQELLTSMNGYYNLSDADLAYLKAKYDGALSYVDYELGRLFTWLRSEGLYDRTLIVVTADHGEEFWEHGRTGHGFTLYDEIIHVPLIMKLLPEARIDRRKIHENVGLIDIMPTLLGYLGLPRPSFMEGLSLRPLIEGRVLPSRALFAEDTYYLNAYAIIQNGYKYIDNQVPPSEILNPAFFWVNLRSLYKFRANELYHIEGDPREQFNLIKAEPELGERMRADLLTHVRVENTGKRGIIDQKTQEELRSLGYVQ